MKLVEARKGRVGLHIGNGVRMLDLTEWRILEALCQSAISIIEIGDAGKEESE